MISNTCLDSAAKLASIASADSLDPEALLDYVQTLANRTLAARVGYFLETRRDELAYPPEEGSA